VATYEYKCDTDNQEASIERRMADEEVFPVCNICNQDMKRVYYAAPVKFNGTGFYSTGG
jgi:predicted nucleic acid-binding Zn ribbon protein